MIHNQIPSGFLLINKPIGVSSSFAIEYIKQLLGLSLGVGHGGTLDPFADGLLVIAIGKEATGRLAELTMTNKEYRAQAMCGILTESFDPTSSVIKRQKFEELSEKLLQETINDFPKEYLQIPPAYSALKHNGKRLYNLMRANALGQQEIKEILKTKARLVTIYSMELLEVVHNKFTVLVTVSSGTYIRSLLNDIAMKFNQFATTLKLTRTKVGNYSIGQAVDLFSLHCKEDVLKHIKIIEA